MAFKVRTNKIVGFWDPTSGPIDGQFEKLITSKGFTFYLFRTCAPCIVTDKAQGDDAKETTNKGDKKRVPSGSLVGVSRTAKLEQEKIGSEVNVGRRFKITRLIAKAKNPKSGREFWDYQIEDWQEDEPGADQGQGEEEIPF